MSNAYHSERFTHEGREFVVTCYADDTMGAPWEEHDGRGPVRVLTGRRGIRASKRPGERLMTSRDGMIHAYDWAEAMRLAKRDGWGLSTEDEAALAQQLGREPTRGEIRAEAVRKDFDHLQNWLYEYWHWMGVVVRIVGPNDNEGDDDHSLWGIESDGDYWREAARELAGDILHERRKAWRAALHEARERRYWATRDVMTEGA